MLRFSKIQGLGNDFLVIDGRDLAPDEADGSAPLGLDGASVRRLCDRRFGVGGDGVILALPPREGGELRMRIFNADGTEPEMCGNGIRCLARFLADQEGAAPGRTWQVETLAGRIVPELRPEGLIRVDMGPPFLEPAAVPTTLPIGPAGLPQGELEVEGQWLTAAAAGMGNPHVVVPVADVAAVELEHLGPLLEHHDAFPARTNVHFVQVLAPDHLVMRVWERGAGPTLACGTGACATLVACHRLGLSAGRARIDLPGGPLEIEWDGADGPVFMSGPAEVVFEGVLAPVQEPLAPAPPSSSPAAGAEPAVPAAAEAIDCATACVNGCVRPDACPSAAARAAVAALLAERSLDELVTIASDSFESRTRARFERDAGFPG